MKAVDTPEMSSLRARLDNASHYVADLEAEIRGLKQGLPSTNDRESLTVMLRDAVNIIDNMMQDLRTVTSQDEWVRDVWVPFVRERVHYPRQDWVQELADAPRFPLPGTPPGGTWIGRSGRTGNASPR